MTTGEIKGRIVTWDEAKRITRDLKSRGKRIGFTNGCFDLIHPGHIALLGEASSLCDCLIVAVNSDASVRRLKGSGRPVIGQDDRAAVVASIRFVDYVVTFEEDTPFLLLRFLKPDLLVKGGDYPDGEIVGAQEVRSWGGSVHRVPVLEGRSTTAIIDKMETSREA